MTQSPTDETVEAVALKPCPFCGGPSTLIRPMGEWLANPDATGSSYGPDRYRVVCSGLYETPTRDCPGRGDYDTELEARAAWNTRAPIPASPPSPAGDVGRAARDEIVNILEGWTEDEALSLPQNRLLCADVILAALRPSPSPASNGDKAGVEQLAVEQIDRDAAAAIYHHFRDHDFATWIMKGENVGGDNNSVIQAFARHRLAALRNQPARTDGASNDHAIRSDSWLARSLEGSSERFDAQPVAIKSRSTAYSPSNDHAGLIDRLQSALQWWVDHIDTPHSQEEFETAVANSADALQALSGASAREVEQITGWLRHIGHYSVAERIERGDHLLVAKEDLIP